MGGRLGEITVILDVRDSQTGEARVRLVDRRELTWEGGFFTQNVAPAAWKAMATSFSEWSQHAREELEGLSKTSRRPRLLRSALGPPDPAPPGSPCYAQWSRTELPTHQRNWR